MKLENIKIKFNKDWKDKEKENKSKDKYGDQIESFQIEGHNIAVLIRNHTEKEFNWIGIAWLTKDTQRLILEYLQEYTALKLYELNK